MSESKKLTQLAEKLTSLDPNDLLYVSANGISKSIKASTIEAPLKTYADTKAGEAQAAAISAANSSSQSAVNAEAVRATAAESGLQSQITSEVSNRISADSSLQSSISVESSRAVAAEGSLQTQISQEASSRESLASRVVSLESDSVTKTYVDGEVSDIQLQINALLSNVDPAALDSFTEVVSAFQLADDNLDGAITTLATELTNSLNAEVTSRQMAVSALQNNLSSEESARISSDQSLQASINAEIVRATQAESLLQSQLTQEVSDRVAADIVLQNNIDTEESARIASDLVLQDNINSEMSRAMGIEASLQAQITQEISDRIADVNNEMYQREAAIENVQAMLEQEQSRAEVIENSLQSQITAEVSARITEDSLTLSSAQSYTDSVTAIIAPTGVIHMFAGNTAPTGYLLCDGSAVSRADYSALFAVIGIDYGAGDNSTTFNLPSPDSNTNIRLIIKV